MTFVHHAAEFLADIIDLLVVALLGVWVLTLVVLAVKSYFKGKNLEQITYDIRISLGRPILLSLELLIVSDVLHSIASRTLEDLGIVATVVVIRVFMAYFLDKELERLNKQGHAPQ
ncbi:hypothetical protein RUE5091_00071 [Ruegeria denitrificans]|uniref:DUF1622 domain-containing protein n=1 Tax=Ruegeria denitrificans TaxID=1715692 RepID=A0A0P1I0G1_9RHOB|nr:hypothetical protein RUE5091_00071 [Ruegeria denitrificans]